MFLVKGGGASVKKKEGLRGKLDWVIIMVPLAVVLGLCFLFFSWPEQSKETLTLIRSFLGDDLGVYYILLGIGAVLVSLYIAFSKFGQIRLGNTEKPQYGSFQWGTMIFTSTMAADILFYSLCEWALYGEDPYIVSLGGMQKWAPTYALFHWGAIAWSFYVILAVAFGFMLHVRGREKQKFSEACRPVLGKRVDGALGRAIDLLAVIALLAGTATTFSLSAPLLSAAVGQVFNIAGGIWLTISILLVIAGVYTLTVWFGMKGISKLAKACVYFFLALLAYVLFAGGEARYIIETGVSSIGNLLQNFISMATWCDPARETGFVQDWTIFYWAYWMAWCVATPFFIGVISKGRTIKNTILGAYGWGLAGTFMSFIVLGNYGMSQQVQGIVDAVGQIAAGEAISTVILAILGTLPASRWIILLLVITMISFYATTFDALTMVVSSYSYRSLKSGETPDRRVRVFWSILFILLPIALISSENSMNNLQSVTIIAAFPIGLIICLIMASFFKDAGAYLSEKKNRDEEVQDT
ncbi:MAG: BCCT family transporter [Clostridiales bacterium]|nr:BCCT family transporter [Clostridiales bacterium]